LTAEWLAGRRARYHTPLQLYLWCTAAFFFAWTLATTPSHLPDVIQGFRAGGGGGEFTSADVNRLADVFPIVVALLIPVFALLTKTMFSSQRRYYSEHAVFALHFHALFFLTGLVLRNESSVTYSAFMRLVAAARAGRNG
jgi:hypothetical protein